METRANYVLIGAFTLFGILGTLGLFLWLAKVESDRQYAYYDILFDSVSGLSRAGEVRYNGLLVGQVVKLSLDEADPAKVRVRVEVDAKAPVRSDTVATLELQGITGITYVSLEGGKADAPPLVAKPGQEVAMIVAKPSVVQNLFEATPELLNRAITLLDNLNQIAGEQNRETVGDILVNVAGAAEGLHSVLGDFAKLSDELAGVSQTLGSFSTQLDAVASSATTTLASTDQTMKAATEAIEHAKTAIDEAKTTLTSARTMFDNASKLMSGPVPELLARAESTAGTVESTVAGLGAKVDGLVGKLGGAGDTALARLTEAEATLAKLDAALDSAAATMRAIEQTTHNVDTLVTGDGAALVADLRRAIGTANGTVAAADRMIREDLPAILAQVRSAAETASTTIAKLGADLSSATGRVDAIAGNADTAIQAATRTFRQANDTLAAVSTTMTHADGALKAAEKTLGSVDRVINEDAGTMVAELHGSVGRLNKALDQVSDDLPGITSEVRTALSSAANLAKSLDTVVLENTDQIEAFMQSGLPQFVRFMQEGNRLIANLQRVTDKIERDPARFLLGTQSPEFRR